MSVEIFGMRCKDSVIGIPAASHIEIGIFLFESSVKQRLAYYSAAQEVFVLIEKVLREIRS